MAENQNVRKDNPLSAIWRWFLGLGKIGKTAVVLGLLLLFAAVASGGDDATTETPTIAESDAGQAEEAEREEQAEREAQEQADREAQEQADREAQEQADREAQERADREAQERADREAQERADREAQEQADREAQGEQVDQEIKNAFGGIDDFRELDPSSWAFYIVETEYANDIIRVTLQVSNSDPVASGSSRAIFSLIGEQFPDADWVEVMDGAGVHIEQTARWDVPLLNM